MTGNDAVREIRTLAERLYLDLIYVGPGAILDDPWKLLLDAAAPAPGFETRLPDGRRYCDKCWLSVLPDNWANHLLGARHKVAARRARLIRGAA